MSIENDLQILFQDLQKCSDQIGSNSSAFFKSFRFIPPSIGIGDGHVIYMSQKGEDSVVRISQALRKNSQAYQAAIRRMPVRSGK